MDVQFKDNTPLFLSSMEKAKQHSLEDVGEKAAYYATNDTPVVTGRARNSITWATKEQEGKAHHYTDDYGNQYTDRIGHGAEPDSVYIGSNVEYFPVLELGGVGRAGLHILRNAATEHSAEYKTIFEKNMKNAEP